MIDNCINHYENKTVAVTGASGYLASALIEALQEVSVHILRVSRQDLPTISGTEALKADVRTRECWEKIISKADVIFHFAGNTSVYAAEENPADSLNSTVLPVTHLVAAAQASRHKRLVVFASTATVYGLTNDLPVSEDVVPKPVTNYDLHKLFAERQLELATTQGFLEGVSLRLANVYGPSSNNSSSDDRGVLNKITRMALQGDNLKVFGDGDYIRDYVYIDDVVRAFMVAGIEKKLVGKSFNVASGHGVTVQEVFRLVAERVEKLKETRVNVENTPWPDDPDPIEFRNFVADITSLQNLTDWHPMITLNEGVDRMVEYFSNKIKSNSVGH